MVIYLKHHIHGRKVAISELEALADEKNGWVRYNVGEGSTNEENLQKYVALSTKNTNALRHAMAEAPIEQKTPRELWTERYGKPPHHRKTDDTLRKELMQ